MGMIPIRAASAAACRKSTRRGSASGSSAQAAARPTLAGDERGASRSAASATADDAGPARPPSLPSRAVRSPATSGRRSAAAGTLSSPSAASSCRGDGVRVARPARVNKAATRHLVHRPGRKPWCHGKEDAPRRGDGRLPSPRWGSASLMRHLRARALAIDRRRVAARPGHQCSSLASA